MDFPAFALIRMDVTPAMERTFGEVPKETWLGEGLVFPELPGLANQSEVRVGRKDGTVRRCHARPLIRQAEFFWRLCRFLPRCRRQE